MKLLFLLVIAALAAPCFAGSPFACDRAALTPQARKRHFDELSPALRGRRLSIRELRDGFEFEFSNDTATFQLVSEWVVGERLCCPFFDIDMHVEREHGNLWLRLTGREGVKQFIRSDFAQWFPG
ncbi:MAG TPA: hypothetical protein VK686_00985 [Bryobacteraceae bacterium]|nr:hypothetical protein [Bryobacteraceae bacterium]